MTANQPKKCTCGRPAASPSEHSNASAAQKCAVCYEIACYVSVCPPKKGAGNG
jgi:hypothetical protein